MTKTEKFWLKVRKTSTCWVWTGRCNYGPGYGSFDGGGAHRFSWKLHKGLIPKGFSVLHRCDNRACVRSSHLFLGTQLDNIRDCMKKGHKTDPPRNDKRGVKHHNAKRTEAEILCIRERRTNGESLRSLALAFSTAETNISRICLYKRWKHLKPKGQRKAAEEDE